MVCTPVEDPLKGHERFQKIRDLNRGSFGFVCLAQDKLANEQVAIKFLPLSPPLSKHVERELVNHRSLLHHHVIQFKGVFLTNDYLGIVLEYAAGGDLLDWIQRRGGITEALGRWLFQQLIVGLDYVHRKGIANRDIKLENTLVDDGEWPLLKICDFGYSKNCVTGSDAKSFVGTRPYLAPEVISQVSRRGKYDGPKADIWASGVFLYVMLIGSYPFESPQQRGKTSDADIMRRIQNVEYQVPSGLVSSSCQDLIELILTKDPAKRPSIKEIQAHPWYTKDLPEGATNIEDLLNLELEGVQSVEDIMEVFEAGRQIGESRLS